MKNILVIFASSRKNGNTMDVLQSVLSGKEAEIIDVQSLNMSPFDYEHENKEDDFLGVAEKMVAADAIIFATPVYWYSMSAQCKVFFDRLSDLITIRKDLGRGLQGKQVFVISSGTGEKLPEGFDVPFKRTCDYFSMEYCGIHYHHVRKEEPFSTEQQEAARFFGEGIFTAL